MNVLEAKDFSSYFTKRAQRHRPSPLKSLLKYNKDPDNIYLASGLPRSDGFPISEVSIKVRDPVTFELVEHRIGRTSSEETVIGLDTAQQYGNGLGLPSLRSFFNTHVQALHKPKYSNWDVVCTSGNTDSLHKTLSMFLDSGNPILMARWCYPTALETVSAQGYEIVSVEIDNEGIVPRSLKEVAQKWNSEHPENICRCLYTVPCGQNPTGATMSLSRRKELYSVAQELNLLIFEDDPYYYLQLPKYDPENLIDENFDKEKLMEVFSYSSLIPTLLSLDTDGRVIRMDSWAKTLAPGLRIGWITAQKPFLDVIQYMNEVSIQQPSGFSQAILCQILERAWGHAKLERHIANIRLNFAIRRDASVKLLDSVQGSLLDFTPPVAGMFLWLRPLFDSSLNISTDTIFQALVEQNVIVVPGSYFDTISYSGAESTGPLFLRICYSFADQDKVLSGIKSLISALENLGCGNQS